MATPGTHGLMDQRMNTLRRMGYSISSDLLVPPVDNFKSKKNVGKFLPFLGAGGSVVPVGDTEATATSNTTKCPAPDLEGTVYSKLPRPYDIPCKAKYPWGPPTKEEPPSAEEFALQASQQQQQQQKAIQKKTSKLGIKELRSALQKGGVSTFGFLEKQDFIQAYMKMEIQAVTTAGEAKNRADRFFWGNWYGSLRCKFFRSADGNFAGVCISLQDPPDLQHICIEFRKQFSTQTFNVTWPGPPSTTTEDRDVLPLSPYQRGSLSRRALHRFLREHALSLPASAFQFVAGATDFLSNSYSTTHNYKESLDSRIIAVDMALTFRSTVLFLPDDDASPACHGFHQMAEDLENIGMFELAGDVYLDMAENKLQPHSPHSPHSPVYESVATFYNDAGVAYQRSGSRHSIDNRAVECYVMGLCRLRHVVTSDQQWAKDIQTPESLLHNRLGALIGAYEASEQNRLSSAKSYVPRDKLWPNKAVPALYALLFALSFEWHDRGGQVPFVRESIRDKGSHFLTCLKQNCKTPEGALEVLLKAITVTGTANRSEALRHYQSTLDSCWKVGMSAALPRSYLVSKVSSDGKRDARQQKSSGLDLFCFGPTCGRCENPGEKFLLCAGCQKVSYCSKGCQVQHWTASHKEECQKMSSKCKGDTKNDQKKSKGNGNNKKKKGKKKNKK